MILELGDGREIQLPDEVSDEFARALKTLILTTEKRARDAEIRVADLHARLVAVEARTIDFTAITTALAQMQNATVKSNESVTSVLKRVEAAVRADRVMVPDEFGEYTRSRVA